MAKKLYEETNIYNIACALREKCGDSSKTYKTCDMADAIRNLSTSGGGSYVIDTPADEGSSRIFGYNNWNNKLHLFSLEGNGAISGRYTFYDSDELERIPLDLVFIRHNNLLMYGTFENCTLLTELPNMRCIDNMPIDLCLSRMFYHCNALESVNCLDNFRQTNNDYSSSPLGLDHAFFHCYKLRGTLDFSTFFTGFTNRKTLSYAAAFINCYRLDGILNLKYPDGEDGSLMTRRGVFTGTFQNCHRLAHLTFDGESANYWNASYTPTIDLSVYVGYSNTLLEENKEVYDDASYQALKNDPEWWTYNINYSRYNKESAIETINSLPSVNAATVIKFNGASGTLTDGGAINTMTEEEIAVATAKGWTVSFV